MNFSPDQKKLIVNYHYVEDLRPDRKGIHPCPVNEFERQISFLSQHFKFVSVPEVCEAAKNDRDGNFCAITFDDGLRDQYENALSILKRYAAKATFFIITATLSGYIPAAHKNHILLSRLSVNELIDAFNDFAASREHAEYGKYAIPKDRRITERRRYDDTLTANFKETMTLLPQDAKDEFLVWAFESNDLDEKAFSRKLFMNEDEVRELSKKGFFIENHTHQHFSLEHESLESIKKELETSQHILRGLLGYCPRVISYPHGRMNSSAFAVLSEEGFTHGVTIEPRAVDKTDNTFLLPRFDTNDITGP